MKQGTRTYGNITFDEKRQRWVMQNVEPHVVIRLKQIFTKIPVYETQKFTLPFKDDISADLKWFMSRYPLEISQSDLRRLNRTNKRYYQHQASCESILLPDYVPLNRVGLKVGQVLREYQKVAVDFAESVKRMLLIDEMGLGKTYEGLAMAMIKGRLPLVIVVEPHLQKQWAKKAASYIDLRVHSLKGNTPYSLPEADIYLVKYNQLSPWNDVLCRGWVKGLVFDEVQNLRTGVDSAKGAAAAALCRSVDFVVGMTGTLIYNYGIEAWNIINIISPGLLGSKDEFVREWCRQDFSSDKGIIKDPDAFGAYLREIQFMLRRRRIDVGQESKQARPETIKADVDEKGLSDWESLAEQLAMNVVSSTGRDRRHEAGQFDLRLRQMTGVAKARSSAAFSRMLVESGTPVVLFGHHHEVYEIWEKELADLKPAFHTGRETPSKKEESLRRFKSGETDIIIMALRSGTGIDDLQYRCQNIVFGELDWSPSLHEQCIRRLDRDGQDWTVRTYYMVSDFGSDPSMLDVLGIKEDQCRGIQDPGEAPIAKQADNSRVQKMAKDFLARRGKSVKDLPESEMSMSNEKLAACL
tara:strand:- start:13193 stop:14938 length:1746 start_codon:yes stop_codon:yes gene_type:complete